MKALIGHTGFVGSNIKDQTKFDDLYNSKTIENIHNKEYDLIVCAGVKSVKWIANKNPRQDFQDIQNLINSINKVKFKKFVLISTIAVYDNPADNPYGQNRLYLETYLKNNYDNIFIVRLPALFGKGLKKNAIYDLLHEQSDYLPNSNSEFQYYCLDNIWKDINTALSNDIKTLNISTEPVKFYDIIKLFKGNIKQNNEKPITIENMISSHSNLWNKTGRYLYSSKEVLTELKEFIKKYEI